MDKNFTSMDIEKILLDYEESLYVRFEEEEEELALPEGSASPPIEKLLAGVLKHRVEALKNKD